MPTMSLFNGLDSNKLGAVFISLLRELHFDVVPSTSERKRLCRLGCKTKNAGELLKLPTKYYKRIFIGSAAAAATRLNCKLKI